jgi:pimeloyl-ACP methyl ester carboxylesterase
VLEVREGTMKGGLPYISVGEGAPLVVFVAGGPTNANPTGWQRRYEVRWLAPLARGGFTVYRVNRKIGLKRGLTMADLADDYALALEDEFANPVDVLGVSTGGMIAQQFAVDHPDLVRRLVLGGAAYRLGPLGREAERRSAQFASRNQYRRSLAAMAPVFVASPLAQKLLGAMYWLTAPLAGMGRSWDPTDMIATIEAEVAFDIGERLGEISAPTLVICGERDRAFSPELFRQTAERIPHAHLIVYEGRGHGGSLRDRRFARDVVSFLRSERPVAGMGRGLQEYT